MLLGREAALARLDELLDRARNGERAAVVLTGEAGIGKTRLLGELAQRAGMQVLRTTGFESESELPFGGLVDLLRPLVSSVAELSAPHRAAIDSALGLGPSGAHDPLVLSIAVLELLSAAASEEPLLLLVDDFQWLDGSSAGVLVFLCHHLHAERIALVIATREGGIDGVESLLLEGLSAAEAAALARQGGAVGDGIAERLAEVSAGNPLALLELCSALTAEQLGGVETVPEPVPVDGWGERLFGRQLAAIDEPARYGLLVAAAAGTPDVTLIARALAVNGLRPFVLEAAEREGLVSLSPSRVEFRHPLVRSAVYHLAGATERRAAHAALAAALVDEGRDDERAWHLAAAAIEPDPVVSQLLEQAAVSAAARGGHATAASAYERAAALAIAPAERGRLLVSAAEAAQRVGGVRRALELLDAAGGVEASPPDAARRDLLRGRIEARVGSTSAAYELMLAAADRLASDDPAVAALALVESIDPCIRAGRPADADATAQRAAALAENAGGSARLYAQVAMAAAAIFTGRIADASELARDAAGQALESGALTHDLQLRAYVGMTLAFAEEWDLARTVLTDLVADCQRVAPAMLPYPLVALGWLERGTGDWQAAVADLEVAVDRAVDTGRANDEAWGLSVLAWIRAAQGHEAHGERLAELDAVLGLPYQRLVADAAAGLLALGRGEAAAAVPQLERALAAKREMGYCDASTQPMVAPDLIEALAACDRIGEAAPVLQAFEAECRRPSARAAALRSAALLEPDVDRAVELFHDAADLHREAGDAFGLARTQLVLGERLRRAGRRRDARVALDEAVAEFERLGAAPWLARCEQQTKRTARTLRPGVEARDELTPAEHQVAGLVCRGLANREIAQRLFMSEKTVEAHLTRSYRKLNVASRYQLMQVYLPVAESA